MHRSFARRRLLTATAALGGAALLGGTAHAAEEHRPAGFPLPNGFRPEGITIGSAPFAYFGSLANGDIYRANLITGRGGVISEGLGAEHPTVGLKTDRHGRLFLPAAPAASCGRSTSAAARSRWCTPSGAPS